MNIDNYFIPSSCNPIKQPNYIESNSYKLLNSSDFLNSAIILFKISLVPFYDVFFVKISIHGLHLTHTIFSKLPASGSLKTQRALLWHFLYSRSHGNCFSRNDLIALCLTVLIYRNSW